MLNLSKTSKLPKNSLTHVSFLVFLTLLLFAECKKHSKIHSNISDARITFLQGSASVSINGGSFKPATLGDYLNAGDMLKTEAKSHVILMIKSVGVVAFHDAATIQIKKLLPGGDTEINLEQGTILNMIDKVKKGSSYKIHTVTSVAGVRGTKFAVSQSDSGKNTVSVTEGSVGVTALAASKSGEQASEKIVKANKAIDVKPNGKSKLRKIKKNESLELGLLDQVSYQDSVFTLSAVELAKYDQVSNLKIKDFIKKQETKKVKKAPSTLAEIKAMYGKVEKIELYNGKVIQGAIVKKSGSKFSVITTKGMQKVNKADVKKTTTLP